MLSQYEEETMAEMIDGKSVAAAYAEAEKVAGAIRRCRVALGR